MCHPSVERLSFLVSSHLISPLIIISLFTPPPPPGIMQDGTFSGLATYTTKIEIMARITAPD